MPYPSQVTDTTIVDTASALIERDGAEALSLARVATELGIKAPSLYRYFDSKSALLQAVNLRTNQALIAALIDAADAAASLTHADRIMAVAHAYRGFAHAHPRAYALAYSTTDRSAQPDPATLAALAQQVQAIVAPVSGSSHSLAALRGLWALVHGFIVLELTGQFQRGGDLDAAYGYAVAGYVRGISYGAG
ncbi:MAG: TetR/AcrR family transcriptional regulator [Chloroflexi bacterium]|nr:TetR/AcrR family transcriptional regulator [Chloroflexota bacterium]